MRHIFALFAVLAVGLPLAGQQPGRAQGQGMPALPEHWVPFDSLAQIVRLTDEQQSAIQRLHNSIDSIVRRGATVRGEMRQEMQRNPDREQAQRFLQRLQNMQQRADRLLNDLKAQLTEDQKDALATVRAPLVVPPRRPGGRN